MNEPWRILGKLPLRIVNLNRSSPSKYSEGNSDLKQPRRNLKPRKVMITGGEIFRNKNLFLLHNKLISKDKVLP